MRVLIVNTSERTGGAAVAANRLMEALNNNGVKAKMLVRDKETTNIHVVSLRHHWRQQWNFLWERFLIFCHLRFHRKHLFDIDTASHGADITKLKEFQEADVIHIHWVNQGMLSLEGIRKILNSGKRVVWTMHDIWPATSLCHVTLGCETFKTGCHSCKYLGNSASANDLSAKIWRKKLALMQNVNKIRFVACSKWLAREAESSALFAGRKVAVIPNPINTSAFFVADRAEARSALALPQDKLLIGFIAQRATNVNKGMAYLVEACKIMSEQNPELKDRLGVVILGGHAEEFQTQMPLPTYPLGYISDPKDINKVYNAIDVFVLPSLSENLPNTIMEALACGVPCVGFNTGGIPEMIDHCENGYVAEYKNASDLAEGIRWTLQDADTDVLRQNALKKVHSCYSQQAVAAKFIELYSGV